MKALNLESDWHTIPKLVQVADILRQLALDETLKEWCQSHPFMRRIAQLIAARYIAGSTIDDAIKGVRAVLQRGHQASVEYMGESCRDSDIAKQETEVFLDLIRALDQHQLPCSISFDLSHIGSEIDPELGFQNALRIAIAAQASGREMMISMEGSARTDRIFQIYRRLQETCPEGMPHIGITIQARLLRSAHDLPMLCQYPGKIRLVKGAYFEAPTIAYQRGSLELNAVFQSYAKHLIENGHHCSIATHDAHLQQQLCDYLDSQALHATNYEFESLIGLGTEQIDFLKQRGMPTREYVVFGQEFYLYVLNRIAESPTRIFDAILDAGAAQYAS